MKLETSTTRTPARGAVDEGSSSMEAVGFMSPVLIRPDVGARNAPTKLYGQICSTAGP